MVWACDVKRIQSKFNMGDSCHLEVVESRYLQNCLADFDKALYGDAHLASRPYQWLKKFGTKVDLKTTSIITDKQHLECKELLCLLTYAHSEILRNRA